MAIFDARLIGPNEGELAGTLGKAMKAANRENRDQPNQMARDAAFWGRFAQDVLGKEREGRRRSCNGGRTIPEVIAAWWTDPAGRKHVRIIGRTRRSRRGYGRGELRGEVELRGLPPWWHVYPEAVLGVRGAKDDERFIAVCRCGAIGSPESLGWMGNTCGPCFDRNADGGAVAGGFGQFGEWSAYLARFCFTPDGRLIGPDLSGTVRTVDRADGSAATGKRKLGTHIVAMVTGADGTLLAMSDGAVYRWRDTEGDVERVLNARQPWGRVALAPDGSRLTLLSYQQTFTADLTANRPQYARHSGLEGFQILRYAPDGRLLGAAFNGDVKVVDVVRGTSEMVRGDTFADLPSGYAAPTEFVLSPDGSAALVRRQSYHPSRTVFRHIPLAGGPTVDLKVPDWHQPTTFVYTPDGRHAVTAETQSGWVGFWDVSNGKSLGFVRAVLEDQAWRGGQVEFAPDGRAVAVGYSTGHHEHGSTIAVWSWPEVMNAAGA